MNKKPILIFTIFFMIASIIMPVFAETLRTVDEKKADMVINSKRITEIQNEIAQVNAEIERANKSLDFADKQVKYLNDKINEYNSYVSKYLAEMISAKSQLETAKGEEKDKLNAQVTDLNALIKQAKAYISYLQSSLENYKNSIQHNNDKLVELKSKVAALNKELENEKKKAVVPKKPYIKPQPKPATKPITKPVEKPAEKEKFNIEYINIYGEGTSFIVENVEKGQLISPPDVEEAEGTKFVGWFIDENFSEELKHDAVVTGNQKIYAKWERVEKPTEEPKEEEPKTTILQEGDPDDIDELRKLIDDTKKKEVELNAFLQDSSFVIEGINSDLQKLEDNEDKCNLVKAIINDMNDSYSEIDNAKTKMSEISDKIASIDRSLQYLKDGKFISEEEEMELSSSVVEVKGDYDTIVDMSENATKSLDEIKFKTDEITEECTAVPEDTENTKKIKVGAEEESKGKSKKMIFFIIGGVAILAIAGVAIFLMKRK